MVGFRDGIIRVGTDIGEFQVKSLKYRYSDRLSAGGSIRVPSAFNFLYGFDHR
jgi:hypothetical protein